MITIDHIDKGTGIFHDDVTFFYHEDELLMQVYNISLHPNVGEKVRINGKYYSVKKIINEPQYLRSEVYLVV